MIRDTIDILRRYRSHFRNWISVVYHTHRGDSMIDIILRSGYRDRVSFDYVVNIARYNGYIKIETLLDMLKNNKIPYRDKIINLKGVPENGDPFSVFIYETYKFLSVEGEEVIDIGANIGDSAIYFAINGAKRVVALEPYEPFFDLLLENVEMNGLSDKIVPLKIGYGEDGEHKYNLYELMRRFGFEECVLKMDCEGCEYGLIEEDDSTIRKFKRIEIEYHKGIQHLANKLERNGFYVKIGEGGKDGKLGIIFASKEKIPT